MSCHLVSNPGLDSHYSVYVYITSLSIQAQWDDLYDLVNSLKHI
jgi:hypothetical protein